MIDSNVQNQILQDFSEKSVVYEGFARKLSLLIQDLLSQSGYIVHSVTHRCKSKDSLAGKLRRPDKSYASLSDITDLAGLRVTTYFGDDVDRVADLLRGEFDIDLSHSSDKRKLLDTNQFGYQSLHFVAKLNDARKELRENFPYKHLSFEIQVRSILQHAWAEIEHDLGYKTAQGVPAEIRRRFSRVAGLLELADAEFLSIRDALQEYENKLSTDDVECMDLNLASLRSLYVSDRYNTKALDQIVASVTKSKIFGKPTLVAERFLTDLKDLGVKDVAALEKIAQEEASNVRRFTEYWTEGAEFDQLDIGIGLFYLLYVLLRKTGDRDRVIRYFVVNLLGAPDGHEERADRLLAFDL